MNGALHNVGKDDENENPSGKTVMKKRRNSHGRCHTFQCGYQHGRAPKYINGVMLLKAEFTGPTTSSLGIPGPSEVSTYDLFIVWHHVAMSTLTPSTQSDRNAAHRGPVFLPCIDSCFDSWNLISSAFCMTIRLRFLLGLGRRWTTKLGRAKDSTIWQLAPWRARHPVRQGLYADSVSVKIDRFQRKPGTTNHGLRRAFGSTEPPRFPNGPTHRALTQTKYDQATWNSTSWFSELHEGWNRIWDFTIAFTCGSAVICSRPLRPMIRFFHEPLQCGSHLGGMDAEAWWSGRVYAPGDNRPLHSMGTAFTIRCHRF
jgi:hypothetical protein